MAVDELKQGQKYRTNDGSVATITRISGNQVSFMLKTFRDQTDIGKTTKENFKKRFPIEVK
ncbi:MAG TPA: hypothetical protein VFM18_04390 [Methanosarcina sp.]|nr:hypothetical protein [Methanosarcina sp.]